MSLPNQGNLENGIFHGTDYTGHNKIKTPPICWPDLLVGKMILEVYVGPPIIAQIFQGPQKTTPIPPRTPPLPPPIPMFNGAEFLSGAIVGGFQESRIDENEAAPVCGSDPGATAVVK